MKFFCREDHREKPRDLKNELLVARARLAKFEALPYSSFTVRSTEFGLPSIIRSGVHEKPRAIARLKADIAELQVLVGESKEVI